MVISNCVINLSADKRKVLAEAARVLRPGGRFAVSDVIADPDMDEATRADMEQWTGCVAGALTRIEFEQALADAGLRDIELRETHRLHEHASSAIVRARKPKKTDPPASMTPSRQAADRRPLALAALDPTGYSVDDNLANRDRLAHAATRDSTSGSEHPRAIGP